jgi:hypothetical protein
VVRQFGQSFVVSTGLGFKRRRDALVQSHTAHRCQFGDQRLPDDGVIETVTAAGFFDDDACFGRFVESVDEIIPDHALYQIHCKPAAHHRGSRKGLVGSLRQPRKSAAYSFSNALRQSAWVPTSATFVDMTQRLDEEEGIAAGDSRQRPGQLLVVIACLGNIGADIILVQPAQLKAIIGPVAVQVGKHRRQRVGAVEIGTAVRADDLNAGVLAEAKEMS